MSSVGLAGWGLFSKLQMRSSTQPGPCPAPWKTFWWVLIHGYLSEYFSGLGRYRKRFPLGFVRDEGPIAGCHQKSLECGVCSSLCGHTCLLCPSLSSLCWLWSHPRNQKTPCAAERHGSRKPSLCSHALPTLCLLWGSPRTQGTQLLFLPWMQNRRDVASPSGGCRAQPGCPFGSYLPPCSQIQLLQLQEKVLEISHPDSDGCSYGCWWARVWRYWNYPNHFIQ